MSISLDRNPMEFLCLDPVYCLDQVSAARRVFGQISTTPGQYKAMKEDLVFLYIHCSTEQKVLVQATLEEANFRQQYYESCIWGYAA